MKIYTDGQFRVISLSSYHFSLVVDHIMNHGTESKKYMVVDTVTIQYLSDLFGIPKTELDGADYFELRKIYD